MADDAAKKKPTMFVASDPRGAELAQHVLAHARAQHGTCFDVVDLGTFPKYYEGAHAAASRVHASRAAGGADRALLLCGTGQGMQIVANKLPRVFAAVVESPGSAADASAINNANVLCLGGLVLSPQQAVEAVDTWLGTAFKASYPDFAEFLDESMRAIPAMVDAGPNAGGAAQPTAAIFVDGGDGKGWAPIGPMGHGSCVWCTLRADAAALGALGGTRLRALARFPAGAVEPPHHHSCGHDVLVLRGRKTVENRTTKERVRLGPLGYLYTPAGHVHRVTYHEETVFYLGCEAPLDILWDDPAQQGVQWESDAARAAADAEGGAWAPRREGGGGDGVSAVLPPAAGAAS